ncbi:uncharacterized protein TRIADDRAFT_37327 [Trichoplax adhaerens]|uniref:Inhibitor of growth protein n=1 Tax=Trichoplax adhaerens TaxID=10228 RepID=B3RRF0_TRIAD|nr:hypothetical protein TRIADDRAFT_37327 [Trichoplax adhaerens]EDV26333.1 hypothetical protein TRIADDRAFT_37327 [Trichoplax adhaerens]|eukprot:XP_002110329.1 hypothetical protein TRIADDRAFT_37327 [Trichoplax adhaerens]
MCAAIYVDNYLEAIENLPDEVQRNISRLRDIDSRFQSVLNNLQRLNENFLLENDKNRRRKYFLRMQRCLIETQEFGDEKLENISQMVDLVENRNRQLELDVENVEASSEDAGSPLNDGSPGEFHGSYEIIVKNCKFSTVESHRRTRSSQENSGNANTANASSETSNEKPPKKKPRTRNLSCFHRTKPSSPVSEDLPIDPDEPTYCLCGQVSFGEMIGCDNDDCPIEWFHFQCVGLNSKPKGKWYCLI